MKYVTMNAEQHAETVRSALSAVEAQHAQAEAQFEAGVPGHTRERVEELESSVKALQTKLAELEKEAKKT